MRRCRLVILVRQQHEDGGLYTSYQPFQNRLDEGNGLPRLAHGAWVLARAGRILGGDDLKHAADRAINHLLQTACVCDEGVWLQSNDEAASVSESSFLLLALSNLVDNDPRRQMMDRLSATLARMVQPLRTHLNSSRPERRHRRFPGLLSPQALLALAVAAAENSATINENQLHRSFSYYRHRFRYRRDFGQVTWLMQAFSKWWQVTGAAEFAEFVFEIADWLLGYQQREGGRLHQ